MLLDFFSLKMYPWLKLFLSSAYFFLIYYHQASHVKGLAQMTVFTGAEDTSLPVIVHE